MKDALHDDFKMTHSIYFVIETVKRNVLMKTWWCKSNASDLIGVTNIPAAPIFVYSFPRLFYKESGARDQSWESYF